MGVTLKSRQVLTRLEWLYVALRHLYQVESNSWGHLWRARRQTADLGPDAPETTSPPVKVGHSESTRYSHDINRQVTCFEPEDSYAVASPVSISDVHSVPCSWKEKGWDSNSCLFMHTHNENKWGGGGPRARKCPGSATQHLSTASAACHFRCISATDRPLLRVEILS